jgi:hypothetical protein
MKNLFIDNYLLNDSYSAIQKQVNDIVKLRIYKGAAHFEQPAKFKLPAYRSEGI